MHAAALSTVEFDLVDSARARLGESPVWDALRACLWWVDIDGRRLFCWYPDRPRALSWQTVEMPGFVTTTSIGLPAIGMESGIFTFDPGRREFRRIVAHDEAGMRYNDATVDGSGRLWAGTMAIAGSEPAGKLFCIGPDLRPVAVLTGLFRPNGLAADARRSRLYLSDSHPAVQSVWTFELDPDLPRLGDRRLFADFAGRPGRPDGAAIDADGNYWIAAVDGGCIRRFAPDGGERGEIATPFGAPTKPAFGGEASDWLFVTSKGDARRTGGRVAFARSSRANPFRGLASRCWNLAEREP